MPKRTTHNTRSNANTNPISKFLRRPVVQLGIVLLTVVVIALIVLSGSPGQKLDVAALPSEINTTQGYKIYQEKGAYFVDVREQSEWDNFHIPGTTLIPLGELPNRLNEVPKDQPIVVVCNSGNRSQSGRDILKQAGYTNVTSMDGGVSDWKTQGFPIEP